MEQTHSQMRVTNAKLDEILQREAIKGPINVSPTITNIT
jgi:hypothetical protein